MILGVMSSLYFLVTGTVWAVTGEFTRLGGHAVELFGAEPSAWLYYEKVTKLEGSPLDRTDGWIVIAMLAGSLIAALAAGDFRWRVPPLKRRFVQALAGGIVAGFGARLAFGCNLAAMFTGIPQFSLHAWLFTLMTAVGTWVGVLLIKQRWWRGPTLPVPARSRVRESERAARSRRVRQLSAVALVAGGLVAAALAYVATGRPMLAVAIAFGTAFGALIQRGQICFTAAFRDLWVTRKTKLNDSLILGLAAASIVTFAIFLATDMEPLTKPAGWGTLLGGFLFGLGIIMAGACETGMMYRAMEGQVVAWVAFIGNVIGATVLAYGWDHWGIFGLLVKGAPKVNFVSALGLQGAAGLASALALTFALLGAWWLACAPRRSGRKERMDMQYGSRKGVGA